jgi:hypothetical protein
VGIVLSVLAALAVIGMVAGASSRGSGSDSGSAESAPVPADPSVTVTPYATEPADHITRVGTGGKATDDGLEMRVRRITRRRSVAGTWTGEPRLYPTPGHVFAVVDVDYSNKLSQPIEPFCAGGARLYSTGHRAYEMFERTYHAVGNDALCGDGIQPDETATAHLMFDVPRGTHFAFIDLYNNDDKGHDILGHTRLRMSLVGMPGA